ncbi:MAG: class I SAM-dependent methyltransferase [Gammaproteobacteria bacterium]|nr:class I SAM-dependent methyltransferase [Gammaproteobacteria bacterium]
MDPLTLRLCPFCRSAGAFLFYAGDENRRVSDACFSYLMCSSCEAVFLPEPPADLSCYYQSEYYDIPALEQFKAVAGKDRNKIETVLKFARGGRLLEIGPAFGVFAWQAKQAGFVVDVIEMDARCCEFLRQNIGVNVRQSNSPHSVMPTLPQHEVIAIWHVLEHLPEPLAFLRAAAANLAPGGVLVIAMPNPDAFQFRLMGRRWPHLDAPRHLTLIPAALLARKAQELGLDRVYLTSDDSDARSWNRFGWQRLLMNRFAGKFMQRVMFVLGYALSLIMMPFDRKAFNGSAYTIVFRKKTSP